MSAEYGEIQNVWEETIGSFLATDASAGATSLVLFDASWAREDGGTVFISDGNNTETDVTYTGVVQETGTLTGVSGLTNSYVAQDTEVRSYPLNQVRYAEVVLDEEDEALKVRIPLSFWTQLKQGVRSPDETSLEAERVTVEHDGYEYVIADVLSQGSQDNPNVQIFTTTGDHYWEKPLDAAAIEVIVIGGGGGGGGGAKKGNVNDSGGGGGGQGGSIARTILDADVIAGTEVVTVGAGGAGGAGATVNGANGSNGGSGLTSIFGSDLVRATGGANGTGGTATAGTRGAGVPSGPTTTYLGGYGAWGGMGGLGAAGADAADSPRIFPTGLGGALDNILFSGGGGGGGGGSRTTGGGDRAGGQGGDAWSVTGGAGGSTSGGIGGVGAGDSDSWSPGAGGGGGGSYGGGPVAFGGAGGTGGAYGGGGGGGGAGTNGLGGDGGNGGTGADGVVIVIVHGGGGGGGSVTGGGGGGGGATDHGALTGLADDDHPQYPQAGSTETISGNWGFDASFALTGDTTSTTTGTQNDVNPGTGSVYRWNGAGAAQINGFSGGTDGRILVVENVSSTQVLTLDHGNVSSAAGNRFDLPDGVSMPIEDRSGVVLVWDATGTVWRVLTGPGLSNNAAVSVATSGTVGTTGRAARSDHAHSGAEVDHDHSTNTSSGGGANIAVGTTFAIQSEADDTQVGSQAAWNPGSTISSVNTFQWKGASAITVQGILNQGGGRWILVHNASSGQTMTFKNEDAAASSFNRVQTPGGTDFTLGPAENAIFEYNNDQVRWRPIAKGSSGGVTAHSALTGLSADDHPQYPLVVSAETISGLWTFLDAGADTSVWSRSGTLIIKNNTATAGRWMGVQFDNNTQIVAGMSAQLVGSGADLGFSVRGTGGGFNFNALKIAESGAVTIPGTLGVTGTTLFSGDTTHGGDVYFTKATAALAHNGGVSTSVFRLMTNQGGGLNERVRVRDLGLDLAGHKLLFGTAFGTDDVNLYRSTLPAITGTGILKSDDMIAPGADGFWGPTYYEGDNWMIANYSYRSEVDNAFYNADKWATVSSTGFAAFTAANLFNNNVDDLGSVSVAAAGTGVITIDHATAKTLTYPQGYIYMTFYYTDVPLSVSGRMWTGGAGSPAWVALTNPVNVAVAGNLACWRLTVPGDNYVTKFELTVNALPGAAAQLVEVEYHMVRPAGQNEKGYLKTFEPDSLYGATTWKNSSNATVVTVATDGTVTATGQMKQFTTKNVLDTDHTAAADPHTGYRLESADHSHQSTGLQGGTLDHGLALTGLGDDDHPQYPLAASAETISALWNHSFDPAGGNVLKVTPTGNASTSTSVGGALLLENTSSSGAGMVIYSNHATSTARLLNIRADNAGYAGAALHIDYDGVANAFEIAHDPNPGTGDASALAASITSTNPLDTTLGVSGSETGKGTIKVTHTGTGTDGNASAISILLAGSGTAAQGIFMDSQDSLTTGTLLNLRNLGADRLVLTAAGLLKLDAAAAGASAGIRFAEEAASNLYRSAASTVKTDGSFSVAGTLRLNTDAVNNSSANNSRLRLLTTGVVLDHNLADANTAVLLQNVNATATGNIADFKNSSTVVAKVDINGQITQNTSKAVLDTDHTAAADPHTGYLKESEFNAKGDLITASANDTPSLLTVGANDTILMADSAAGGGLKWAAASASATTVSTGGVAGTADEYSRGDHVHAHETAHVAHDTIWDAKGDIVTGSGSDTAVKTTVGTDGFVLLADSASAGGVKWATPPPAGGSAPDNATYLTTTSNATLSAEVVVGATPGGELGGTWASPTVDTTHAGGQHYALDAFPQWTAKGELIVGTGAAAAAIVGVGANDTILMADSAQTAGVRWQAPATTTELADTADTEGAGTSDTWARGDHVHALHVHGANKHTDITSSLFIPPGAFYTVQSSTGNMTGPPATLGAEPDQLDVVRLDDAVTDSAYAGFQVPLDWASGALTLRFHLSMASTSALTAVRLDTTYLEMDGGDPTRAGTNIAAANINLTSTVNPQFVDFTLGTPSAAGALWRVQVRRTGANAGDTYNQNLRVLGFEIRYTATQ